MIFSGCQPAAYTRYQTAHTLGKGEMKLMGASHFATAPQGLLAFELDKEMDKRLERWQQKYGPGDADWEEFVEDIVEAVFVMPFEILAQAGGFDVEILYAIGVAENVDIELRATATGYLRGNVKVKIADMGTRGAMAISPGVGWRSFSHTTEDDDYKDQYRGNVYTGELPLIFGWKFDKTAIYFAPTYIYHMIDIRYSRDTYNMAHNFSDTIEEKVDFHIPGIIAGVEFSYGHFVMTPEISFFHTFNKYYDSGYLYPGLALGGKW